MHSCGLPNTAICSKAQHRQLTSVDITSALERVATSWTFHHGQVVSSNLATMAYLDPMIRWLFELTCRILFLSLGSSAAVGTLAASRHFLVSFWYFDCDCNIHIWYTKCHTMSHLSKGTLLESNKKLDTAVLLEIRSDPTRSSGLIVHHSGIDLMLSILKSGQCNAPESSLVGECWRVENCSKHRILFERTWL